jgi:type II secretory pathway pseudopilin PulG
MKKILQSAFAVKNIKGTSLIEIIVGIAIIAIISGLVLSNFRVGERTNNLHLATQKLVSDIRLMQGHAMSLKNHNGIATPGGWGIYLNSIGANRETYIVFADTDVVPDHYCDNFNQCRDIDADYSRIIELPKGIEIIQLRADSASYSLVNISFEPPTPTVFLCHDTNCNATEIEITLSNNSETKTIFINKFGLIDVK